MILSGLGSGVRSTTLTFNSKGLFRPYTATESLGNFIFDKTATVKVFYSNVGRGGSSCTVNIVINGTSQTLVSGNKYTVNSGDYIRISLESDYMAAISLVVFTL